MMTKKTLKIIGSGRDVWLRTRDPITDVILETELVDHQMGGATVLLAKYEHRESADIDVILTDTGKNNDGLRAMELIAKRTNAEIMTAGENVYQLRFPDLPQKNHLDLFIRTEPEHAREWLDIEGRKEPASTTTEVLYGKIMDRGYKGLTRDVLDIAITGRNDPSELEQAVNAIPAKILLKTISEIGKTGPEYQDSIKEMKLHGSDARKIAKDLATMGQIALLRARYSTFDLDMKDHSVELHTDSRLRGPRWKKWSRPEETQSILRKHWYDHAMTIRGVSVDDVLKRVHGALRNGTKDRIHVPCETFTRPGRPAPERPAKTGRTHDVSQGYKHER